MGCFSFNLCTVARENDNDIELFGHRLLIFFFSKAGRCFGGFWKILRFLVHTNLPLLEAA